MPAPSADAAEAAQGAQAAEPELGSLPPAEHRVDQNPAQDRAAEAAAEAAPETTGQDRGLILLVAELGHVLLGQRPGLLPERVGMLGLRQRGFRIAAAVGDRLLVVPLRFPSLVLAAAPTPPRLAVMKSSAAVTELRATSIA